MARGQGENNNTEEDTQVYHEDDNVLLELSLSTGGAAQPPSPAPVYTPPPPPPVLPPRSSHILAFTQLEVSPTAGPDVVIPSETTEHVDPPPRRQKPLKTDPISPPFPWSETKRAVVRSLEFLLNDRILKITGEVHCKKCDQRFEISFDLEKKFLELSMYVVQNLEELRQRAPRKWMSPILPNCVFCNQEKCVKPVIATKKRMINWLFLFLGEMLGCCTLEQLKYFCKYTKNHRTGAKDRVLFLVYLELCKQLDPSDLFDI